MKQAHRTLLLAAFACLLCGCKASYLTAGEQLQACESKQAFQQGKPPIATIGKGSKLEVVDCEYMKAYRAIEVVTSDGHRAWVVEGDFDLELNRACDGQATHTAGSL